VPVITMASIKGGAGKSTLTLVLAGAFAADGYRVDIIDADRAGRLLDWAKGPARRDNITVRSADEHSIQDEIARSKREGANVTLVDVEGTANVTMIFAAGASDLVLIPANPSTLDVTDALKTQKMIRNAGTHAGRTIPHGLVWSRVPSVKSREMALLDKDVADAGLPVLGAVYERTPYKAMFSYSTTLEGLDRTLVPNVEKSIIDAGKLALSAVAFLKTARAAA